MSASSPSPPHTTITTTTATTPHNPPPDNSSSSPSKKKHKSLSSLSPSRSPQPPPTTTTTTTKKKKKKSNNVWTKPTSRKGKKKPKPKPPSHNHHPNHPPSASSPHDTVLITPVPRFPDRSDDSPDAPVRLSRAYKADKVELNDDRLTAGSTKGYRMVRATRGVADGAWYFEIKVLRLGETGHTRLGWTTEKGDLQAPVGYDAHSFGYRDVDGSKVHKALREQYGEEGYAEGDVVGFYIHLPDGRLYEPKPPNLVWYKGQRYMYPADGKDDPPRVVPGSEISFFKNGKCQGVAYTDLVGGRYYPAASMYTLPNQPNCEVRFNFGPNFDYFPQDFGDRPLPRPMIEVPYHGHDGRTEGAEVSNGLSDHVPATENHLPTDLPADANGPSEDAGANALSVETTAVPNSPTDEGMTTLNDLAEEAVASSSCLPEEMNVDMNGTLEKTTIIMKDPADEMVASSNASLEKTMTDANGPAEEITANEGCLPEQTVESENTFPERMV